MPGTSRRKILRTTLLYWMLLGYVIAALVWWFISLENQNQQLANKEYENLFYQKESLTTGQLTEKRVAILNQQKRNTEKYTAEGIAFLILILVGASFVYRSVRRQFRLQQQQQNFMMAVTHELKTPISVAKLNLETLQKYNLDPDKQKKLLRNTLDETARLNFLTNNILISSQLDEIGHRISKEDLNFSDLLKDCLSDFNKRHPDRTFSDDLEPEVEIKGDTLLLQMMINNLLENAIKYSPKESPVSAVLKKHKSGVEMHIIDQGKGIPDEEKKKIFSKFYRIGNETTRKTQGTGLGLYLCRKICKDHNADISVTDNIPHGSIFTVVFRM